MEGGITFPPLQLLYCPILSPKPKLFPLPFNKIQTAFLLRSRFFHVYRSVAICRAQSSCSGVYQQAVVLMSSLYLSLLTREVNASLADRFFGARVTANRLMGYNMRYYDLFMHSCTLATCQSFYFKIYYSTVGCAQSGSSCKEVCVTSLIYCHKSFLHKEALEKITVAAHLILHLKSLAPHIRYWQIRDFQAWLLFGFVMFCFALMMEFMIKNCFSLGACVLGYASVLLLIKIKKLFLNKEIRSSPI